jgi:hypothetical protein
MFQPELFTPINLVPSMTAIFGNFIEDLVSSQEYLIIGFSPSSTPLKQRWRNNGLSADFLADYISSFFPGSDEENNALEKRAEIRGAISYIANELLENAMKYNNENSSSPISIQLHLHQDRIILKITNSIYSDNIENFQAYLQEILESDPEELYIRQLEKNAMEGTHSGGKLGYLTMLNDYGAKLGWKFQQVEREPETTIVTTMVQLIID